MSEGHKGGKNTEKGRHSSAGERRPEEAEEAQRIEELKRQAAAEEHKERERREGIPRGRL